VVARRNGCYDRVSSGANTHIDASVASHVN
jgi:hypothetical protein